MYPRGTTRCFNTFTDHPKEKLTRNVFISFVIKNAAGIFFPCIRPQKVRGKEIPLEIHQKFKFYQKQRNLRARNEISLTTRKGKLKNL